MNDTTIHFSSTLSRGPQTEATSTLKQAGSHLIKFSAGTDKAQAAASPKTDQTSLSSASGLIGKALSVSDVRTEKVAGLQKAIAAGTYKVSSADVAGKLLQSLLGE